MPADLEFLLGMELYLYKKGLSALKEKYSNYLNKLQTLNAGGWPNMHINKFPMYASVHMISRNSILWGTSS